MGVAADAPYFGGNVMATLRALVASGGSVGWQSGRTVVARRDGTCWNQSASYVGAGQAEEGISMNYRFSSGKWLLALMLLLVPSGFATAQTVLKDAEAYNHRGIAYVNKGQFDQAISDYNKALELNPMDALAYYNRGVAYYSRKDYDKAWDDVYKAQGLGFKINPGFLKDLREASGREK